MNQKKMKKRKQIFGCEFIQIYITGNLITRKNEWIAICRYRLEEY